MVAPPKSMMPPPIVCPLVLRRKSSAIAPSKASELSVLPDGSAPKKPGSMRPADPAEDGRLWHAAPLVSPARKRLNVESFGARCERRVASAAPLEASCARESESTSSRDSLGDEWSTLADPALLRLRPRPRPRPRPRACQWRSSSWSTVPSTLMHTDCIRVCMELTIQSQLWQR